jgi:ABC-type transport system substrate-binding protein
MYAQIQQIVYQQSPFIVIDYSPYRYGVGGRVHGFHVSPVGSYDVSPRRLVHLVIILFGDQAGRADGRRPGVG